MAAPFLSAEINQQKLRELNRRLDRFAVAMGDTTPANREASIALYGWTIRNFDRQGGLQGGWAPLAASTVREKQRIGKQQMLVRTGQLRQSFSGFFSRENAGVGTPIIYSRFHHEGAGRMPQRELLPRQDVVLQIGIRVYGQYVARKAREANA